MLKEHVTTYEGYLTSDVEAAAGGVREFLDVDIRKGAVITWLHAVPINESCVTHYFSVFVKEHGQTGYVVNKCDCWLLDAELGRGVFATRGESVVRKPDVHRDIPSETDTSVSTEDEYSVRVLTEPLDVQEEILRTLKRIEVSLDKSGREGTEVGY